MKKTMLALAFLMGIFMRAQEKTENEIGKNEITINALLPIAFKTFEISYERNINEDSSFGVSAMYAAKGYFFADYALTPYYRKYFSNGYAEGFFIEGFSMINGGENYYGNDDKNYVDLALGVGVGGKFIAKDQFVGTVSLGIGRNLGSEEHEQIVVKGGISLGYRF